MSKPPDPPSDPISTIRSAYKTVSDDGSVRKMPTYCRCLYAVARHVALANHLVKRGMALPYHLSQEMEDIVAGKRSGAGCTRHWVAGQPLHEQTVYYIYVPPDFVKIGYSAWPYGRLCTLVSAGLGEDSFFLALEKGGIDVERKRHAEFKSSRYRLLGQDGGSELFEISGDMTERISEIAEANGMYREPTDYGPIRKA